VHHHLGELSISAEETAPAEVFVRISGELDIQTATPLLRTLRPFAGEQGAGLLLLDLTGVRFCDHAGLRALHALGEAAGPGRVRIVGVHPSVDVILRLCRIPEFLGYTTQETTCRG